MNGLPPYTYVMSETHLSGYRVIIGYETLVDAQAAQLALCKPQAREEAQPVGGAALAKAMWGVDLIPATPPATEAEKLREALEPFAAIARVIEARDRMAVGKIRDDHDVIASVSWEGGLGVLVMGHLRDALTLAPNAKGWGGVYRRSAALAALQQEGK